jgi:hypothetical protein
MMALVWIFILSTKEKSLWCMETTKTCSSIHFLYVSFDVLLQPKNTFFFLKKEHGLRLQGVPMKAQARLTTIPFTESDTIRLRKGIKNISGW